MYPESGETSISAALQDGLKQLKTDDDRDKAVIRLAERYAEQIDHAASPFEALEKFGPKLLAALVELRMTPKARAAVAKGVPANDDSSNSPAQSALDELRARRENRARMHGAATVDTAP